MTFIDMKTAIILFVISALILISYTSALGCYCDSTYHGVRGTEDLADPCSGIKLKEEEECNDYWFSGNEVNRNEQCVIYKCTDRQNQCSARTNSEKPCTSLTFEDIGDNTDNCNKFYYLGHYCEEGEGPEPCKSGEICFNSQCTYEPLTPNNCIKQSCSSQELPVCQDHLKLKLYMPESYKKKTLNERLFLPYYTTPYDDIVCEASVYISEEETFPTSLNGILYTYDALGNKIEISSGKLIPTKRTGRTRTYEWNIIGWPDGWTQDNKILEDLIKTKQVYCEVSYKEKTKIDLVPIESCVHLWGERDAIKISNLFGKSSEISTSKLVQRGLSVFDSYKQTDPFRTYIKQFSNYIELKKTDDSDIPFNFVYPEGTYKNSVYNTYQLFAHLTNECTFPRLLYFYTGKISNSGVFGAGKSYIAIIRKNYLMNEIIHETGHAFCGLNEEYVFYELINQKEYNPIDGDIKFEKNCKNKEEPAPWPAKYGDKILGCVDFMHIKPSKESVMTNTFWTNKFNIISCGYCVNEIVKKILPSDSFEICSKMDTIKPEKINEEIQQDSPVPEREKQAKEKCYLLLEIQEKNTKEFSLLNQTNLYGFFDNNIYSLNHEVPADYRVNVYNTDNILINQMAAYSSLYIRLDNFEDKSERINFDESIMQIFVPYSQDISAIKIEDNGIETDLNIDLEAVKCERTCKIENEKGRFFEDSCCSDFYPSPQSNTEFVCTNCGNGICSQYENSFSCYSDCHSELLLNPDANLDGKINLLDLLFIKNRINQNWYIKDNFLADVNDDEKINILDLVFVRNKFK